MNRRQLLTGFVKGKERSFIRPPYTSVQTDFSPCKECDAPCVEVCEEGVLFRDGEGVPALSFEKRGCSYCGKCLEACPHGVISESSQTIRAKVQIDPQRCSAWNGVLCFSCKEPCLDNAIKFNGLYKPLILPDRCTSCGFCVSVCPTGAIKVVVNEDA